jgi:hypothetical protein
LDKIRNIEKDIKQVDPNFEKSSLDRRENFENI